MFFRWFWGKATIGFIGLRWLSTIGPRMEWLLWSLESMKPSAFGFLNVLPFSPFLMVLLTIVIFFFWDAFLYAHDKGHGHAHGWWHGHAYDICFFVPMVIATGMPMTNSTGTSMLCVFVPMVMATGMPMAYTMGVPMTMCTGTSTIGKHAPRTSLFYIWFWWRI